MSLLGTSPVSSLKRVARRGAPSVDAPGRDEVVIASLAFLVPSGVPNAPNAISPRRRAGRPLVASRARAAHRTRRVRCLAVSRFRSQRGAPSGVPRPVARAGTPRRVAVSGAFQTPDSIPYDFHRASVTFSRFPTRDSAWPAGTPRVTRPQNSIPTPSRRRARVSRRPQLSAISSAPTVADAWSARERARWIPRRSHPR